MKTMLVLVLLSQAFSTWTDKDGVVHAALREEAPVSAKPLSADISVIDADSRPLVLADGGTRMNDSAWWRARLAAQRAEVNRLRSLEQVAAADVSSAARRECVTASATATAVVPAVVRKGVVRRQPIRTSSTASQTNCVETSASPSQRAALSARRVELEGAEQTLRALEREALAAGVPMRDFR